MSIKTKAQLVSTITLLEAELSAAAKREEHTDKLLRRLIGKVNNAPKKSATNDATKSSRYIAMQAARAEAMETGMVVLMNSEA